MIENTRHEGARRCRRWALAATVVTVAASLLLAGCSTESATGSSTNKSGSKKIGVSMSFLNAFYSAAVEGMQAEAKKLGYDLVVQNANSNSSAQVSQVQNLITQGVGAVIFAQYDAASGGASLSAANGANVPVIAVDQVPAAGKYVTYIGSDSVKMGQQACDYLFKTIGGSGDIAIINGVPGSSTQIQRTTGCNKSLAANPGIKVVSTTSANWDQNTAANVFSNVLTAHPDLKAVFPQNDDMALGAINAIQSSNHATIPMVSIDGNPAVYGAIEKGSMLGTISQQPYHMGQLAVQDAIKSIKGQSSSIPHEQIQNAVLVTKDNVAEARAAKYYGSQQ